MDNKNKTELLLYLWVQLEDIRNLTAIIERSLDYEIAMEQKEMRSTVHIIKKEVEEMLRNLGKNIV